MSGLLLAAALLWAGATMALSTIRRLSRPPLADRLEPYAPGGTTPTTASAPGLLDLARPVAERLGRRLAAAAGVAEDLDRRLARVHADEDAGAFRLRQVGWAVAAFGAAGLAALALAVPTALATLALLGAPLLAFLVVEQRLAAASARWQEQLFRELPVVTEQLAMLLGAGYSVGSALQRLARRTRGAAGADLARACRRIGQGLSERRALAEWAEVAQLPAVDRLVAVLALDQETTDLGRLVAAEARAVRREAHRRLLEDIEQRTQKVWVPVTVATLVPGVLLLAVPFLEALRLFSTG